jgi:hypothetical protein
MSADLQNSAKIAVIGPSMGIYDLNRMPRMQNVSKNALSASTPRKGLLNISSVNMSNFDASVASCTGKSFAEVQKMNRDASVSSTDTSCGWVQFSENGNAGASVLGTQFTIVGPIPNGTTAGSKYYPPLLTKSSNINMWTHGIRCVTSGNSFSCKKNTEGEPFTNISVSNKFASVNDEFVTPFLHQMPLPSTTPISRDMYIQTDANAGTMAGTLYQESQRGQQDPNLETKSSYSIFNKAMTNIGDTDTTSWEKAFQPFQPVGNDMYPRPSRDIAVYHGNLEKHDFCAEMNDQTIINENNLACLQHDWVSKGGSPTDYNYPGTGLYGMCYGKVRR